MRRAGRLQPRGRPAHAGRARRAAGVLQHAGALREVCQRAQLRGDHREDGRRPGRARGLLRRAPRARGPGARAEHVLGSPHVQQAAGPPPRRAGREAGLRAGARLRRHAGQTAQVEGTRGREPCGREAAGVVRTRRAGGAARPHGPEPAEVPLRAAARRQDGARPNPLRCLHRRGPGHRKIPLRGGRRHGELRLGEAGGGVGPEAPVPVTPLPVSLEPARCSSRAGRTPQLPQRTAPPRSRPAQSRPRRPTRRLRPSRSSRTASRG